MQSTDPETHVTERKRKRGVLFWLGRVILGVIALQLLIVILIHLPFIQGWALNRITSGMSSTMDTRVEVGRVSLNPISFITLHNTYIGSPGQPEDTLIAVERLSVDYFRIWDILKNRLNITQIGLQEGFVYINREVGDSLTNLDRALSILLPPADTTKAPFALNLKSIQANRLTVKITDKQVGNEMAFRLKRTDAEINHLDIPGKRIDVSDLDIDEPEIRVRIHERPPPLVSSPSSGTIPWHFSIRYWRLQDAKFSLHDTTKPETVFEEGKGLDFAHLELNDLDARIDSLVIKDWDFFGKDIHMRLQHENGFEIHKLAADRAAVTSSGIRIDGLDLQTDETRIRQSIRMNFDEYSDFERFSYKVKLSIPDADIQLHLDDLLTFAPTLRSVDFLQQNADQTFRVKGDIRGLFNDFTVDRLEASIGETRINGDLHSKNIAVNGQQEIYIDVTESQWNVSTLREILPGIQIPEMFDRFGFSTFIGKFERSPKHLLANGTFTTDLGSIGLDVDMNTLNGFQQGIYQGRLSLTDFDAGKLLAQPDLGKITFTGRVIEGSGLEASTFSLDLTGELKSLGYKGYTYRNARVDGLFSERQFIGTVDILDPNIDLHFDGRVDLRDSLPRLDFISRIDSIDLQPLGFSQKPFSITGYLDADVYVGKPDEISGSLLAENVVLSYDGQVYPVDTASIVAYVASPNGARSYNFTSEFLTGEIKGIFDPALIGTQVHQYLHQYYPQSFTAPAKPAPDTVDQMLSWNLQLDDSEKWLNMFGLGDLQVKNVTTKGQIDLKKNFIVAGADLGEIHYKGFNIYASSVDIDERQGSTAFAVGVIAADMRESFFFEEVQMMGTLVGDWIRFNFRTDHLADIFNRVDIDIAAHPENGVWNIELNPQELVMLGDTWDIPQGNKLEFRKNYINLEQFELVSANQRILLNDVDNHGLEAFITGFNISYLNELWINDKFDFAGMYTLDFKVDNLFDPQTINANLSIPELEVNDIPYGNWNLSAVMNDPKDSVQIDLAMHHKETRLAGKGAYLPPIKSIDKADQNYLRMNLSATDFPLDFLEFLMGGNIRDTEGSVDINLSLAGKTNRLKPTGQGKVFNGSTTIDYLGAAYSFHDQSFRITENLIDLSGVRLYDVLGNTALVEGGITHRYLSDLGLAATIKSDRILGLDVTSEENDYFYGRGIGSVDARFSGTVANPVIYIETTTARGTNISIPLTGATGNTEGDFAIFLENGLLPANTSTNLDLGGVSLTMVMKVTPDAVVEIIFDPSTGDILQGRGQGTLTLNMSRTGNLSMYGNYEIEKGNYLFNNFYVVRKSFDLEKGGKITWDGDPYDANLNITASYSDLKAAVYPLIQEYISDGNLIDEAKVRTPVDLQLILTGSLLQPDIQFDIGFPQLTGEIKAYTDSKMALLRSDKFAMTEQVAFLMFGRTFVPSSQGFGTGLLTTSLTSTITEALTAAISGYLSNLLGDIIPTGNFLTGVELRLGLELPNQQSIDPNGSDDPFQSERTDVYFDLPLRFFNDRLEVNVGGNYVTGAAFAATDEYWAGDITFRYQITPDRRLIWTAYNRNNLTVEGRKNKLGVGLTYRREYESFGDFLGIRKKNKATDAKDDLD